MTRHLKVHLTNPSFQMEWHVMDPHQLNSFPEFYLVNSRRNNLHFYYKLSERSRTGFPLVAPQIRIPEARTLRAKPIMVFRHRLQPTALRTGHPNESTAEALTEGTKAIMKVKAVTRVHQGVLPRPCGMMAHLRPRRLLVRL
jgi:hypothetical protein